MKIKQNTYRTPKKRPLRKSAKLIVSLLALNAAVVILCEQTHEGGYVNLLKDAVKTVLNHLTASSQISAEIPMTQGATTSLSQHDVTFKKNAQEKVENQNSVEIQVFKPLIIKQYYTSRGRKIDPIIQATVLDAATKYDLCPFDIFAQIEQESFYNPDAVSSAGASGLMQFMPKTWEYYGRDGDVHDIHQNIDAGARMMKDLLKKYKGDKELAWAAYNAGSGNVDKWVKKNKDDWKSLAFKETADYINKVQQKSERIKTKTLRPFLMVQSRKVQEKQAHTP